MILKHADVKTAYLHGILEETVYMRPPPGVNEENRVLKSLKFEQSKNDSCLYIRRDGKKCVYLVVYVDDLVIACEKEKEYAEILRELNQHFDVMSLGDIKHFLGIEVNRSAGGISLNQTTYIQKLLDRFGMTDAKPSKFHLSPGHIQSKEEDEAEKLPNNHQYASLIGGLLYVAVNTRSDISAAVSILGRKTSCPTHADWLEAKRVVRYLKRTLHDELFLGVDNSSLKIYVDADWAGDSNDRKSTSGFLFRFHGGYISWSSKKQTCVTLSSTEAETSAVLGTTAWQKPSESERHPGLSERERKPRRSHRVADSAIVNIVLQLSRKRKAQWQIAQPRGRLEGEGEPCNGVHCGTLGITCAAMLGVW
ncbi:uncharacterized protein LOC129716965 [Wyeomyia smithii]|uniref:uncharacterized protein LOC129716965 n=1 Tax=Wyeomyia smithii TaxID=174621 RepID=UPI002468103E|nr:uncharacterized protein LOC129716965 [Wyeomyia smithii]